MKKIILLILLFFINIFPNINNSYANTLNTSKSYSISTWWTDCDDISSTSPNSHWVIHKWVPTINNLSWASSSWTLNCTNHTYYYLTYKLTFTKGNHKACNTGDRVIDLSWSWDNWTITCQKWDDTMPKAEDIWDTTPINNSKLLAKNAKNFSFTVSDGWESPIKSVKVFFENWNSVNDFLSPAKEYYDYWTPVMDSNKTSSSPKIVIENISNVDNNRDLDWWREYSLVVAKICDEAWNCNCWWIQCSPDDDSNYNTWTSVKTFKYRVYANTLADKITTKSYIEELSNDSNIADWTQKRIIITLKDIYWNAIVPATWINRTIDFNWNTTNSMYLNQYSRTWQTSVFVNRTWTESWNYLDRFPIWENINTSFNWETSTDWTYTYWFKFYTPTSNQNYWPVSDPNAKFVINSIKFDINWNIIEPLATPSNQPLNSWIPITAKFSPLYYTKINGSINDNWFIEWATQVSKISIIKNWPIIPSNRFLQLSYWWASSWNFKMFGWTNSDYAKSNWEQIENIRKTIKDNPSFPPFCRTTRWESGFFGGGSYTYTSCTTSYSAPLYTRLIQNLWTTVLSISNLYLATHIEYSLDWKNIVYNSDIVWKNSYHDSTEESIAIQWGLKTLWQVSSKSNHSILNNQMPNDVKIIWNTDKFITKTQLRKNRWEFAKNVVWNDNSHILLNINNPSSDGIKEVNNVIYFWGTSWYWNKIYQLWRYRREDSNGIGINTNKTILVIWWNLYIKNNLYYSSNNWMLGILVLKDQDWNWWNIYIHPDVTNIVWTLFAEKSILSYNWIELDWNAYEYLLKNQLHIYGSVFSENTIWGSRETTPRCPYFITSWCTLELAQKYDLNYLRRYRLITDPLNNSYKKPANNWKVIWWWIYYWSWIITWWNTNFARNITNTSDPYAPNSTLIEYNPRIQSNIPPLFENK